MEFRVDTLHDRVVPPTEEERRRAREHLEALAVPRMTGSEGAEKVAAELRGRFEALGYEIRDLPFHFSAWPGRFALAVGGGAFFLGALAATLLLWSGEGGPALLALAAGAVLAAAVAIYAPRAVPTFPLGRVESANWVVHRPGARPRWLIVAHRDSKSQLLPTSLRVAAVPVGIAAWLGLVVFALVEIFVGGLPRWPLALVGGAAILCGLLLALCWVGNASPGALDNATGLAALLGLAERERESDDVAFLVTDGEELVLAGAMAVAPTLPPIEGIINLDVLDDHGPFCVVERHGYPRRGRAPHLVAAILSAAHALDLPARRRDLPIGVMTDHTAFTDAGLPSVTLHRGTLASFGRLHRPSDDLERVKGEGAAAAVAMVDGALRILRAEQEAWREERPTAVAAKETGRRARGRGSRPAADAARPTTHTPL